MFFSLIFSALEGFVNLKHVTKKLVSQNYHLGDSIEKALFKQFRRVQRDTALGLVSRILETDEFVVVVDDADHPLSIITHFDLLSFVANDSSAASTVKSTATKAVTNGSVAVAKGTNGVHANGH